MRRFLAITTVLVLAGVGRYSEWTIAAQSTTPFGKRAGSWQFAVIGDMGTGEQPQYDVARQMVSARARFPFELVIMTGDNMYGRQEPQDFESKFERPYRPLLDAGVRFYAALGNHDDQDNRLYPAFNMNSERYYSFAAKGVRFFVIDTNILDPKQLAWIEDALKGANEAWKIAVFHHPLYSNGDRHGSNVDIRVVLEPMLLRHAVQVVFTGHDHIYERLKPQKGITHFVIGSSGQLRKGDLRRSTTTAAGFDQDQAFAVFEVAADEMAFQAISRTGTIVDSGVIRREPITP